MAKADIVGTNAVEEKKQSSRINTLKLLDKLIKDFNVDKEELGEDYFKGLDKDPSKLSKYEWRIFKL